VATQNNSEIDTEIANQGSHIYTSTYANRLENGKFQGFVHTVRIRGTARTEQEFACAKVRETEEQALADALALTNKLPGS
jgi:uncharacterized protein involved in outer membrane biogenesis